MIQAAIVGCGNIAHSHVEGLLAFPDRCRIAALCDIYPEKAEKMKQKYGLANLPDNLRQMAEVRLANPDAPLRELGEYLDPPVGKSGVNHRLRKLSELADRLREMRKEQ